MKQNNHISNDDDDNDDNDDGKLNNYHNKTYESNNHNSNNELNQFFEKTITANGILPSSSSSSSSSSMISATGDGRIHVFSQLSLSRPLLRAIEHTGYVAPTPIQIQTIPYALAGKDICGR